MKSKVNEKLFNKVKGLLNKGLTGIEVCKAAGISQPTLYRIKNCPDFSEFHSKRKGAKVKVQSVDIEKEFRELNMRLDYIETLIRESHKKRSIFHK